jgi:thioredoxin 1
MIGYLHCKNPPLKKKKKGENMNHLRLLFATFLLSASIIYADVVEIKGVEQLESEVLQSGKPAIVKVSATWCGPCKQARKPFEALSSDPANADMIFAEVDADASPDIYQKYKVQSVPTFIFIKNGQEVKRTSGFNENFKPQMTADITALKGGAAPTAQPAVEKKTEEPAQQPAEQGKTVEQPEAAAQIQAAEQPEIKAPAGVTEEPITCAANPPDNFLERAFNAVRDFFTSIIDTISGWFK